MERHEYTDCGEGESFSPNVHNSKKGFLINEIKDKSKDKYSFYFNEEKPISVYLSIHNVFSLAD